MNYQSIYDHDAIQEANTSMYGQTWDTTYVSPESAEMIHLSTGRRFIIQWSQEIDNWTGRIVYRMTDLIEHHGGDDWLVTGYDLDADELHDWSGPDYRDEDTLIDAAQDMTEHIISNT